MKTLLIAIITIYGGTVYAADELRYLIAGEQVAKWIDDLDEGNAALLKKDYATVLIKYKSAAEKNSDEARYKLGIMYESGEGVVQDYTEAVRWFRLSASQGNTSAQNYLGHMYESGKGVAQNNVRAHMWSNLAAVSGDATSVKNRAIISTKMTQQQIAEAQKMARECQARKLKNCD